MSINNKILDKYTILYDGLKPVKDPIKFFENSPHYMEERWLYVSSRYIPDVMDNVYMVSDYGRIYSYRKSPSYPNGGIMKPSVNGKGYNQINLNTEDGIKKCVKVHRLVMLHFAFIPGCQYLEIDHIDGNKDNNWIYNLRWLTLNENIAARDDRFRDDEALDPYYNFENPNISDEEASVILQEYYNPNINYKYILESHNVDIRFVQKLVRGYIRPHLANRKSIGSIAYKYGIDQ